VSSTYQRLTIFASLALAGLIPYVIGLGAYVFLAWIPSFLLTSALLPNVVKLAIPPKLEDAQSKLRRTTLRRTIESFISQWMFWTLLILWNAGVSTVREGRGAFFRYLGCPLAWFDSAFFIHNDTSTLGKIGIFLANSFVCALFFFPFSILFRRVFRHTHVTQLSIYNPEIDLDKDDDDE
jgi:hypothetical protein